MHSCFIQPPKDNEAEYREAFSLFDLEETGEVSTSELGTMLRAVGQNPSQVMVEQMVKEVDPQGKGSFGPDGKLRIVIM